jgi:hypothetical protein
MIHRTWLPDPSEMAVTRPVLAAAEAATKRGREAA